MGYLERGFDVGNCIHLLARRETFGFHWHRQDVWFDIEVYEENGTLQIVPIKDTI